MHTQITRMPSFYPGHCLNQTCLGKKLRQRPYWTLVKARMKLMDRNTKYYMLALL